jgi:LCP family protein required for cell wall assembly
MTEWPDDWFRDGAQQAGGQAESGQAAGGQAGGWQAGGSVSADPTVQLPVRSAGAGYPAPGQSAGSPPGPSAPGAPRAPGAGTGWPDQPPPRTTGRPPRGPYGPGPNGPGYSPPGGAGAGSGWRRWLRPKRIVAVLAVLLSLALIGSVISYFYLDSKLKKENILVDYPGRPAPGAGQNWLIAGSDSRQGLSRAEERKLATGFDVGGERSDTIMILHMPAGGGRPVLISLPRDSYVPIPGHGYNKINAAFSIGGPQLLAETVQNITGLYISHFMDIGFGGFVHVVNAIGGVRICLKAPLVDPASGLHLHAGCQNLNGAQSLGFVRSRHTFASQDLQRIQNQRVFLRALLRKMTSAGVLANPLESFPAASGVAGALTVDSGTSLYQLVKVAFALRDPITTTVPIANSNYQTPAGDALLWNKAEATQLFNDLRTDQPIPRSLISGSTLAG